MTPTDLDDPLYCAECGRERLPNEYTCPACGCDLTMPSAPGYGAARALAWTLGGPLAPLLRVGPDRIVLLHGEPSGGKTSVALAALGRPLGIAELVAAGRTAPPVDEPGYHARPAWLSTSEMSADLVRDYSARLGYRVERVSVPRFDDRAVPRTGIEAARCLGIDADHAGIDLILDSLTELSDPLAALRAIRLYVRELGCRAIVVAQDTKDGDVRGSRKIVYQCDVVVKVTRGPHWRTLTVGPKNRCEGGAGSALFTIRESDGRIALPEWGARYYIVDGRAPAYRLIPWPSPEASNLGDPCREAERRRVVLPPAPCAVAASRSDLYPSGWSTPDDVDQRRAFAERAGLRFADTSTFRAPE
jgi:hypothetical protein